MNSRLQRKYAGGNILAPVVNLLDCVAEADGVIIANYIYSGEIDGATAKFNLRKNGAAQFVGGDRPQIADGADESVKTGFEIAVVRGDLIQLDVEDAGGGIPSPVFWFVEFSETGSLGTIKTAEYTTAALADLAAETGLIGLAKSFEIHKIVLSHAGRAQFYSTAAYRTADAARPFTIIVGGETVGNPPTGEHGVIADFDILAGNLTYDTAPVPVGTNREAARSSNIPIRIQNRSGAAAAITMTVTYLIKEV